jgi:3',5'-cyclic AMP phosphodiesterase CpdA
MRIALISDIHYGTMSTTDELTFPGESLQIKAVSNASPLFQGLIESLKEEKPDYLFIAGDLTSTGSLLEFKYCYQKIDYLANEIGITKDRLIFCLGNHDVDWKITREVDSYKDNAYSEEDRDFLKKNYQEIASSWAVNKNCKLPDASAQFKKPYNEAPLAGVVERDDCVVFVLNSGHLCSHDESTKHGRLSTGQLRWFEESVKEYASSEKIKIVLLHHQPIDYFYPLPVNDQTKLTEGGELCDICGKSDVALVLHGHRHHPNAKTVTENGWANPLTVICAGSLSVNTEYRLHGSIPNTFHIIDFNDREKINLKNYEYSLIEGWTMTEKFRREVPLEGSMLLGKPINVNASTTMELIRSLKVNTKIMYSSLGNDLSYLPRHQLLELAEQMFEGLEVYDKPDHFIIYKPPEENA